ncbi:hypothetical protein L218DRAFT_1076316 [Marasmius fiardii PR-910]|nr:hypothetical protein L218DRAFT_1076316 [Marasmius fiardii PR-910]
MSRNLSPVSASDMRLKPRKVSLPRNSRKDAGRLRLPSLQTTPLPIPPSLLQSPYLTSPQSILFQTPATSNLPSTPTAEDETWLRDTIPISGEHTTGEGSSQRGSLQVVIKSEVQISEGSRRSNPSTAPPSPPLIRAHKSFPERVGGGRPSTYKTDHRRSENYFNV